MLLTLNQLSSVRTRLWHPSSPHQEVVAEPCQRENDQTSHRPRVRAATRTRRHAHPPPCLPMMMHFPGGFDYGSERSAIQAERKNQPSGSPGSWPCPSRTKSLCSNRNQQVTCSPVPPRSHGIPRPQPHQQARCSADRGQRQQKLAAPRKGFPRISTPELADSALASTGSNRSFR